MMFHGHAALTTPIPAGEHVLFSGEHYSFLSSLKTLLMPTEESSSAALNVPNRFHWQVFTRPRLAGFARPPRSGAR